jgi:putative peptidoglycan lipid II flippase
LLLKEIEHGPFVCLYAWQNIRTPVKIGIVTLLAAQAMNALFIGWIQHAGLALAITLWFGMDTEQSWLTSPGWSRILRLSALVAGGLVVYFAVLAALGFRHKNFSKRAVN